MAEPATVRAGLIGAGQFGAPIVTQALFIPRLDVPVVADSIRERIEGFHCVKCPKACKGSNLIDVDGVSLCTGFAYARRIYSYLRAPEDFASIQAMLDMICSGGPR